MANHSNGLLKEPFGGLHIPLLASSRFYQIAIMINGSREIAPFSVDLEIRFVHVPGSPSLTPSFSSQLVRNQRSKSSFPIPYGLMGKRPPTLQKHLGHITEAQFVTQPPEDDEENDIRGVFERVERSACALIKKVFAGRAAECPISQDGFLALFFRRRRGTRGAIHGYSSSDRCFSQAYSMSDLHAKSSSEF
jgi:hypothetical protein